MYIIPHLNVIRTFENLIIIKNSSIKIIRLIFFFNNFFLNVSICFLVLKNISTS